MPSWRNCVALLPLKEKVKGSSPFGGTNPRADTGG